MSPNRPGPRDGGLGYGELGPIDILVNNAGTNLKERTFRELTPETWDRLIRTNLDGAFYCIHAVLPAMLRRKDGLIINVVSIAGKRASPLGGVAYAARNRHERAGHRLAAEEKDSASACATSIPRGGHAILEVRPQPVTDEHRRRILRPRTSRAPSCSSPACRRTFRSRAGNQADVANVRLGS